MARPCAPWTMPVIACVRGVFDSYWQKWKHEKNVKIATTRSEWLYSTATFCIAEKTPTCFTTYKRSYNGCTWSFLIFQTVPASTFLVKAMVPVGCLSVTSHWHGAAQLKNVCSTVDIWLLNIILRHMKLYWTKWVISRMTSTGGLVCATLLTLRGRGQINKHWVITTVCLVSFRYFKITVMMIWILSKFL